MNPFDLDVGFVLWDTTIYFEGQACGRLARYGFSKDKRRERLEVMTGVTLTRDRFSTGHDEVFSEETAEVERFRWRLRKPRSSSI